MAVRPYDSSLDRKLSIREEPPESRIVDCYFCGDRDIEDNMSQWGQHWACGKCASEMVDE